DGLICLLHHLDEVLHLDQHAARCRGVRHLGNTADTIEPEPDQGLALGVMTADRAAGLLDLDGLCVVGHGALPVRSTDQSAACSASAPASRRRPCKVDTLMLRRAGAPPRGTRGLGPTNVGPPTVLGWRGPRGVPPPAVLP